MTRKFLWGVIVILLLTNLTTLAVWMNERFTERQPGILSTEVDEKEPVATVGGETISYEQWTTELESKYGEKVLKQLVDQEVVFQLAEQEGIEISDKLIDREVSFLFTMQGDLNQEEIKKREQTWTREIKYRLLLEELLTKDINVNENDVMEYHANYSKQYEFDESIQLSHILVEDAETADKIVSELDSGASFKSLAREYSIDGDSRDAGGYLGYFTEDSNYITTQYYNKSLQMEEHTYSEPFVVGNNIAILYLHRYLPAITFSYEEIKPHIERELALEQIDGVVTADELWGRIEVDWIYE